LAHHPVTIGGFDSDPSRCDAGVKTGGSHAR
jgi:hypothetical protein